VYTLSVQKIKEERQSVSNPDRGDRLSLRRSRRPPVGPILRFVQAKDRARARFDGAPAVVQFQA
jgi:hypothetical protein